SALDFQRDQCGVAILAEAPLVGIRDERDRLRADHLVSQIRLPARRLELLVPDQQPRAHELLVEAAGHQPTVVLAVDQIHLTAKVTLLAVDETGGIAERDSGVGVGRHDRGSFSNTPSRMDLTQDRRKNDALNNPATRTWKSMLPVPGSRYPHR